MTMIGAPVTKTLVLSCTPETAFAVFTEGIEEWWPVETHSVFKQDAVSVSFEPGVGGRIVETSKDGTKNAWAEVSVWEPPTRIVFSWAPDTDKSVQTEVEVTFESSDGGTRFQLVHRGWERWGEKADAYRNGYDGGWNGVLERFANATA